MIRKAPYGSWLSPLTIDLYVKDSISFQELASDGFSLYWTESRPFEKGRAAVLTLNPDNQVIDLLPDFSIRSKVHEYGGGALCIHQGDLYFTEEKSQSIYRFSQGKKIDLLCQKKNTRFADGRISSKRNMMYCVAEEHCVEKKVDNLLINIDLSKPHLIKPLIVDQDFIAYPRLSRKEDKLAWISWNRPHMPWQHSQLWMADIREDGSLEIPILIAGDKQEAVTQPVWAKNGDLYFLSDRSGWWNIYRLKQGVIEAVYPVDAECSSPLWILGRTSYALYESEDAVLIVCVFTQKGVDHLAFVFPEHKEWETLNLPFTVIRDPKIMKEDVFFFASSPLHPLSLIRLNLKTRKWEIIKQSFISPLSQDSLSFPKIIEFPSQKKKGYAFFYPPKNPAFAPLEHEMPPLLVKAHGGPTACSQTGLNLEIQFWTSRGFAFLDVNYSGSSGFGRSYRDSLNGKWGILDVEDCISAAQEAARKNLADIKRIVIKGSSAGGFTALCALTFHQFFAAGTCYYGIADLEQLVKDTHKFEADYLTSLIGPYSEMKQVYQERSPLHHAQNIHSPLLLLQGKEDKIVPLQQAEDMYKALKQNKTPVALLSFNQEGHGFKRAETIKRCLEAELSFYSQLFNLPLLEKISHISLNAALL